MVMNSDIRVRVSKNQLNQIKQTAQAKGFTTVSDFVRDVTIGNSFSLSDKINEIHNAIVNLKAAPGKNPVLYNPYTGVPYKVQKEPGYDPFYEDALKYLKSRYR